MSRRRGRRTWRKTRRYLATCWHAACYVTRGLAVTLTVLVIAPFLPVINAEVIARRGRRR